MFSAPLTDMPLNPASVAGPFTVLILEDELIVARDLAAALQAAGYRVVGPVRTGREALHLAATEHVQLALVDISIEGPMDGIDTAGQLWSQFMTPSVIVTGYANEEIVTRAARPGVLGYLLKPVDERQLLALVRFACVRHETERPMWKSAWEQTTILEAFSRMADEVESTKRRLRHVDTQGGDLTTMSLQALELSKRERDVLRLLMDSHRVPTIARMLFISQHTVRNHLKAMYRKVGVSSQAALIERVRQLAARGF